MFCTTFSTLLGGSALSVAQTQNRSSVHQIQHSKRSSVTPRNQTCLVSLKHYNALRSTTRVGSRKPTSVFSRQLTTRTFASASSPKVTMADNPLLVDAEFPLWDQVKAEHVVPGMEAVISEVEAGLADLEKSVEPTWSSLVSPLERLSDRLGRTWGVVTHLKGVKDNEQLRKAVEEIQPKKVELSLKFSQSKPIYDAFCQLRDGPDWAGLSEAQKRIVEGEIRDAKLGGVGLEGEAKERFNAIQQELSSLSTKFSNNLLDATKAYSRLVEDKAEVAGLPDSALALAAQQAKGKGHEAASAEAGPWLFTLDMPSYLPVMQHCQNRELREHMYKAFITRASDGDLNNTPLIESILKLKLERAKLLGYDNHAEVSMAAKMATLPKALELLEELRVASFDKAVEELDTVREFAKSQGAAEGAEEGGLKHWDLTFWAERLKEDQFDLKEEELRPYFALPVVMEGMFALAGRLFGVKVEPADGSSPTWHPDVKLYQVKSAATSEPLAHFYLDPYSRPEEKRGGAWMDEVVGRSQLLAPPNQQVRLPVAHMVCNQSPPIGDKPSLMTFREVETMFHEFGHALQHMLTKVDEGLVSGIRGVEWDAVELPSQFMENWCYHKPTILGIAQHHETGEPLPDELYNKIVKARTYRAASMMMRQLHFACTDLALHSTYQPDANTSVYHLEREVAKTTMVMPPMDEDRFLCGFGHIFAGGYAAGYYSYKWAEVLSADAFSAFEEAGLDNDEAVADIGQKFRNTVLALGGAKAPMDVFVDFRGREPSTEPLLRHSGLVSA